MAFNSSDCQHLNEITDTRSGDVICTSCGLVLDLYYINSSNHNEQFYDKNIALHNSVYDYLCEMLERLNISKRYLHEIISLFNEKYKFYSTKSKHVLIAYCCYQILNENNVSVSIKNISAVTGFSCEEIYKMQDDICLSFDVNNALEKYCNMLYLSFKDYSVIKESLSLFAVTGHHPLTLISAAIYRYCLNKEINRSLDNICEVTGISKISVQRYLRNL